MFDVQGPSNYTSMDSPDVYGVCGVYCIHFCSGMQYFRGKREKAVKPLTKITFNSSQINALSPNGTNLKYDDPLNNGTCKMENFIQFYFNIQLDSSGNG